MCVIVFSFQFSVFSFQFSVYTQSALSLPIPKDDILKTADATGFCGSALDPGLRENAKHAKLSETREKFELFRVFRLISRVSRSLLINNHKIR
jgi:hypothetical protein